MAPPAGIERQCVMSERPIAAHNFVRQKLTGFEGEIGSFALWMKKQGYREFTIRSAVEALTGIARHVDLLNPDMVKLYLADSSVSESRKERLTHDLDRFYKWKNIPFEKPRYRKIETLPFVPLETEIDQLISGSSKKTAVFLQLLKETGMRCGEAWDSKWTDIDSEKSTIVVKPEKNSRSRVLRISGRLIAMVNDLPKSSPFLFRKPEQDRIDSLAYARRNFEKQRKRIAMQCRRIR